MDVIKILRIPGKSSSSIHESSIFLRLWYQILPDVPRLPNAFPPSRLPSGPAGGWRPMERVSGKTVGYLANNIFVGSLERGLT